MQIELKRDLVQDGHLTFGKFYLDGVLACEVLEPPVRELDGVLVTNWKVRGDTAIPRGRYRVIINHSHQLNTDTPLLLNVPGFEGVRIFTSGFDGWITVGVERVSRGLLHRREAFRELLQDIHDALNSGEQVWVTVG